MRRKDIVSCMTKDQRPSVVSDDDDEIDQFRQSLTANLADREISKEAADRESANDQHGALPTLGLRPMRQVDGGTAYELLWDCWLLQAPNSHYCHNRSVFVLDLISTSGLRCLKVELRPASDPAWNTIHKNHKTTLDEFPERVIQRLMSKAFSVPLKLC